MSSEPFGRLLGRLISERDLSIPQFAKLANFSRSQVDHIVNGRRRPPLDRLEHWASLLKLKNEVALQFITFGELEHTPENIRKRFLEMERKLQL